MQIYAVAAVLRLVRGSIVPAIFSAASLSLCLFNRSVCGARVRKIRNVTVMENYIPRILNCSTRST